MKKIGPALILITAVFITIGATAAPPRGPSPGQKVQTPQLARLLLTTRTTAQQLSDANKPNSPFFAAVADYMRVGKIAQSSKNPGSHYAWYQKAKKRYVEVLAQYDAKVPLMHDTARALNREVEKYVLNAGQNFIYVVARDEVKAAVDDWRVIRRKAVTLVAQYDGLESQLSRSHSQSSGTFDTQVAGFERLLNDYVKLAGQLRDPVAQKDIPTISALYPRAEKARQAVMDAWVACQAALHTAMGSAAEVRFNAVAARFDKHYRSDLHLMARASTLAKPVARSVKTPARVQVPKKILMPPTAFGAPR